MWWPGLPVLCCGVPSEPATTLTGGGRSAVPDESALTPPPPPVGRVTTPTGTPGRRLGERRVAIEVPAQRP